LTLSRIQKKFALTPEKKWHEKIKNILTTNYLHKLNLAIYLFVPILSEVFAGNLITCGRSLA